MASLEEQVSEAIRSLAPVNPLTREVVVGSEKVSCLLDWSPKRVSRAILNAAKRFRDREQFGKFRASLLLGIARFGDEFLLNAERAGTLLDRNPKDDRFSDFLAGFALEAANSKHSDWTMLRDRLMSYRAYAAMSNAIDAGGDDISSFLSGRPRRSLRMVLVVTALAFLREYFGFDIPSEFSDLVDELGPPEEISSIASLLVVLASEYYPLDSLDFAFPSGGVESSEIRRLMVHGKAMVQRFEIAKYISLFRYSLEEVSSHGGIFYLRPPFPDFEYALRLGYIRSTLNAGMARPDVAAKRKGFALSLQDAAERFADRFRDRLGEIKDPGTERRRLRINFPVLPELYATIKDSAFYEDFLSSEQDSQDFLVPLQRISRKDVRLTGNLDLDTFHGMWRYLRFLGLVDIALLRTHGATDPVILLNSLVRTAHYESTLEFLMGLGVSREQAEEFFGLVSADVKNLGYLDLQYRPFLRIAQTAIPGTSHRTQPETIHLPTLVCTSNVARNLQSANKIRLDFNARVFADAVVQTLRSRFKNVLANRPVKGKSATDIDVLVLEGETLYLFECKHSLPPTGPHEIRDIWEEIEAGSRQLEVAIEVLENSERRQSYLAGWFPGIRLRDTSNLKVVGCVLCSHRLFSGIQYKGFPIRDFGSLSLLCGDGIIGMGEMVEGPAVLLRQFRILRGSVISASDLDNYLSQTSTFFDAFRPFMHSVTRIEKLTAVTIAKETYGYQLDLDEWVLHMETLGCAREPDRKQEFDRGSSGDIPNTEKSA